MGDFPSEVEDESKWLEVRSVGLCFRSSFLLALVMAYLVSSFLFQWKLGLESSFMCEETFDYKGMFLLDSAYL